VINKPINKPKYSFFYRYSLAIWLLLLIAPVASLLATDFDNDGVDDFLLIEPQPDESLRWTQITSSSQFTQQVVIEESFGQVGHDVAVADWFGTGSMHLGRTRVTDDDEINWRALEPDGGHAVVFGERGDIIVSGGNFDGSALADAAVVTSEGLYRIMHNPFAGILNSSVATSESEHQFLKRHVRIGKPTFIDVDGNGQHSAAFVLRRKIGNSGAHRNILVYRDANDEQTRQRLNRNIRGNRLVVVTPISLGNRDAILTSTRMRQGRHQIRVNDPVDGTLLFRRGYSTRSLVVVGDYLNRGYEQFAIRRPGLARVQDFITGDPLVNFGVPRGVLADAVNVNNTGGSQPAPGGGQCGVSVLRPAIVCRQCQANVWIPRSESDGRGVFLAHNRYNGRISSVQVVRKSDCSVLATGSFAGLHNPWSNTGLRSHWRYGQPGGNYGNNVMIRQNMRNGPAIGYDLPNAGVRTEWREP